VSVHVDEGASVANPDSSQASQAVNAADSSQAATPTVRATSPITINPNDSPAKQRMDIAALNVRKLKKERAQLEQVKAAVEEFKAARSAYENETGAPPTLTESSEPAKADEPAAKAEPQAAETPTAEKKPGNQLKPPKGEANAGGEQGRGGKGGNRGGKRGKGQGGS